MDSHAPHQSRLIYFEPLLPEDLSLILPTIYARLNFLNHCQYLKVFARNCQEKTCDCQHTSVINAKTETVKQIISKIVETDTILDTIHDKITS